MNPLRCGQLRRLCHHLAAVRGMSQSACNKIRFGVTPEPPAISRGIVRVPDGKAFVVERSSKFAKLLKEPGVHMLNPFMEKVSYVYSLGEEAIPLNPSVGTVESVNFSVDGVIHLKIVDPELAFYSNGNDIYKQIQAVLSHAQNTLLDEISRFFEPIESLEENSLNKMAVMSKLSDIAQNTIIDKFSGILSRQNALIDALSEKVGVISKFPNLDQNAVLHKLRGMISREQPRKDEVITNDTLEEMSLGQNDAAIDTMEESLSKNVMEGINKRSNEWGLECVRCEINNISPPPETLYKQAKAEKSVDVMAIGKANYYKTIEQVKSLASSIEFETPAVIESVYKSISELGTPQALLIRFLAQYVPFGLGIVYKSLTMGTTQALVRFLAENGLPLLISDECESQALKESITSTSESLDQLITTMFAVPGSINQNGRQETADTLAKAIVPVVESSSRLLEAMRPLPEMVGSEENLNKAQTLVSDFVNEHGSVEAASQFAAEQFVFRLDEFLMTGNDTASDPQVIEERRHKA